MSLSDSDIRDVVAAVGFLMARELPEPVVNLLADPTDRTVRLIRRLVDLRNPAPQLQSGCRG